MNNPNILDQKLTKTFKRGIARTLSTIEHLPETYRDMLRRQLWLLKDDIFDQLLQNNKNLIKTFERAIYVILEIFEDLPLRDKTTIKKRIWLLKEDVYIALGKSNG